jgi:hypothetical protein
MGNLPAQRERDFVAWIKTQRQAYQEQTQRLFVVAAVEAGPAVPEVASSEEEPRVAEVVDDWISKVPDELIVGVAVLGACIGFPIGAAAGGVLAGFSGGMVGALLGALVVLAIARLLKVILPGLVVVLAALLAYAILHALRL